MTDRRPSRFTNRREAGRLLADAVAATAPDNPVVLALPRGGVPVGFEVAKRLKAPLDVLLVRKIGAPGHEENGIGALVVGASPKIVIDRTWHALSAQMRHTSTVKWPASWQKSSVAGPSTRVLILWRFKVGPRLWLMTASPREGP